MTTPMQPAAESKQLCSRWTPELESDLQRLLSVGEECISEKELRELILAKGRGAPSQSPRIRLYDGFEPSGRMHIAQGLLKSVNVNKCTYPGTHSTFCFWVADWFALMNDKMGGDLAKIDIVGQYLIEVWKAAGMNLDHVEFRWASQEITQHASLYWPLLLDVARRFNITRIKKCCQIMGRVEGNLTSAQVLYPLMQCTDVFFLQADVCQLGMDQRKVNMLAREYCDSTKKKFKPVILSHHMLYGLKKGQEKMSKSDPDSAIFMEDTADDVERKICNAYCPTMDEGERGEGTGTTEEEMGKESMHLDPETLKNPILDYIQHIVLSPPKATFTCATLDFPDGQIFTDYSEVKTKFLNGEITPKQLKKGLIDALNQLLQPVRDHFTNDANAKRLFDQVREFKRVSAPGAEEKGNASPKVTRLDLVGDGVVPAKCHLVMAPLPDSNPTLQSVADLLTKLAAVPADESTPKVLMLLDWTARVNNALDAEPKLISAYHAVLLSSLRALDEYLYGKDNSIMKEVTILYQSEAILKDPSSYWISVINAGRHFSLDTVMGAGIGLGEGLKDSEGVGIVIGRLMLIADVLAVNPKSIALDNAMDEMGHAMSNLSLNADHALTAPSVEAYLIQKYYNTKLCHPSLLTLFTVPSITHVTNAPKLQLQPVKETAGHKTEFDEYYLLDDPKVNAKSKMKKAFCEPSNVDFCPPVELLAYFGGLDSNNGKEVTIQRSSDNGGNVTYRSKTELLNDFKSGALHPGDLKNSVAIIMMQVLIFMNEEMKKDDESIKGAKALKAFEKKLAKQKKKWSIQA